jgi:hypothetical protein
MLVALIQGIVSSFHEYLPPFDERGGEESRYRADDHLLHESGVHSTFGSIGNAIKWLEAILPESPLPGLHNPETEEQISNGVRQNTCRETFRAISDRVIKHAGK